MKKLLTLFLCLIFLSAMVSCGNSYISVTTQSNDNPNATKDDPDGDGILEYLNENSSYYLYSSEVERVKKLNTYSITYEEEVLKSYSSGNEITNKSILSIVDGKKEYHNIVVNSSSKQLWYLQNTYYEAGEEKLKEEIGYNEYINMYRPKESKIDTTFIIFPEELIDYKDFIECDDGYYIEFSITGKEYSELVYDTLTSELSTGINDVSYKIYFTKDGKLKSISKYISYINVVRYQINIKATLYETAKEIPSINQNEFN